MVWCMKKQRFEAAEEEEEAGLWWQEGLAGAPRAAGSREGSWAGSLAYPAGSSSL